MEISSAMVKELRTKTGAGMMDCKEALAASDGDFEKAIDFLRKKGLSAATKRSSKAAKDGTIASYIHMGGRIGVMVEINCETDFVAKTDRFSDNGEGYSHAHSGIQSSLCSTGRNSRGCFEQGKRKFTAVNCVKKASRRRSGTKLSKEN